MRRRSMSISLEPIVIKLFILLHPSFLRQTTHRAFLFTKKLLSGMIAAGGMTAHWSGIDATFPPIEQNDLMRRNISNHINSQVLS